MPPSETAGRSLHWNSKYVGRENSDLSWHQDEPACSLHLIQQYAPARDARIIDVGAGTSPLAGRLLDLGYNGITVLDVSEAALAALRARLGSRADDVRFVVGDLLEMDRLGPFDLWHDRAVFHFQVSAEERAHYVDLAARSVVPGGHLVIATFAPEGPDQCSGLPVCRYDAASLASAFGSVFRLVDSARESHTTPWGASQPFTYAVLQRQASNEAERT